MKDETTTLLLVCIYIYVCLFVRLYACMFVCLYVCMFAMSYFLLLLVVSCGGVGGDGLIIIWIMNYEHCCIDIYDRYMMSTLFSTLAPHFSASLYCVSLSSWLLYNINIRYTGDSIV